MARTHLTRTELSFILLKHESLKNPRVESLSGRLSETTSDRASRSSRLSMYCQKLRQFIRKRERERFPHSDCSQDPRLGKEFVVNSALPVSYHSLQCTHENSPTTIVVDHLHLKPQRPFPARQSLSPSSPRNQVHSRQRPPNPSHPDNPQHFPLRLPLQLKPLIKRPCHGHQPTPPPQLPKLTSTRTELSPREASQSRDNQPHCRRSRGAIHRSRRVGDLDPCAHS